MLSLKLARPNTLAALNHTFRYQGLLPMQCMAFTGKTESGHKFTTPKMRLRVVRAGEPPGLDFKIPEGLEVESFLRQIGGDCEEYADKFESIEEVFNEDSRALRNREIPTKQRKYIMRKWPIADWFRRSRTTEGGLHNFRLPESPHVRCSVPQGVI